MYVYIDSYKLTDPGKTIGVNYNAGNYRLSNLEPFKDYILKVLHSEDHNEVNPQQPQQKPSVVVNFVDYYDFMQIMTTISPLNVDLIIKTNEYFDAMAPESVLEQQFLRTVALFHDGLFLCTNADDEEEEEDNDNNNNDDVDLIDKIALAEPVPVYSLDKQPRLWFPLGYDSDHKIKLLAATGIYKDSKVPLLKDVADIGSIRKLYEDCIYNKTHLDLLLQRLGHQMPSPKPPVTRVQPLNVFLSNLANKQ